MKLLRKVLSLGMRAAKLSKVEAKRCVIQCTKRGLLSPSEGTTMVKNIVAEVTREGKRVARFAVAEARSEFNKARVYARRNMTSKTHNKRKQRKHTRR